MGIYNYYKQWGFKQATAAILLCLSVACFIISFILSLLFNNNFLGEHIIVLGIIFLVIAVMLFVLDLS